MKKLRDKPHIAIKEKFAIPWTSNQEIIAIISKKIPEAIRKTNIENYKTPSKSKVSYRYQNITLTFYPNKKKCIITGKVFSFKAISLIKYLLFFYKPKKLTKHYY